MVARLATQLGTVLIAAEARRAERTPNPDAFDLYLQGMAWLDKDLASRQCGSVAGLVRSRLGD